PGACNSIPSRVVLEIDVRDIDLAARDRAVEQIRLAIEQCSARRGVRASTRVINADPPAAAEPKTVEAIQAACRELSLRCLPMVSRAYHDSLFMARICPTGM